MQSLFKPPKNSSFKYVPRFYDERKEELEEAVNQYEDNKQMNVEAIKMRVLRKMRSRYYGKSQYAKKALRRSRLMVFLIAILLLGLSVLVLGYFPEITNI